MTCAHVSDGCPEGTVLKPPVTCPRSSALGAARDPLALPGDLSAQQAYLVEEARAAVQGLIERLLGPR